MLWDLLNLVDTDSWTDSGSVGPDPRSDTWPTGLDSWSSSDSWSLVSSIDSSLTISSDLSGCNTGATPISPYLFDPEGDNDLLVAIITLLGESASWSIPYDNNITNKHIYVA